jgi:hypothetical protein
MAAVARSVDKVAGEEARGGVEMPGQEVGKVRPKGENTARRQTCLIVAVRKKHVSG